MRRAYTFPRGRLEKTSVFLRRARRRLIRATRTVDAEKESSFESGPGVAYLLNSIREPPATSRNYVPADVIAFIVVRPATKGTTFLHVLAPFLRTLVRDKKQRPN